MTEPTLQAIADALVDGPFDQTPPDLQARLLTKAAGIAERLAGVPPMPTNVIEALARVEAELPGIGKDQKASEQQGGYAYRGIEAITAHAGARQQQAVGGVALPDLLHGVWPRRPGGLH